MNLKNKIRMIFGNQDHSLQERLFRLITTIGIVGLILGLIVGILNHESIWNLLAVLVVVVLVILLVVFTLRTGKVETGAVVLSALVLFVVLPMNFLTAGGIYGGAPIWFILGFVLATIVVEGRYKYFLLAGGYLTFLVCYDIAYFHPSQVVQHTLDMAYIDSIATLTIVSVVICVMLQFQNAVYRAENNVAKQQKKEIEELNQAQNRFFSSMSHEIRTPINTIIGLNEMILREEVSDEVAEDAYNIQNASRMLLSLINDILDMSKIRSGKMDIVPVVYDVGAMLSDLVNMIWVRAREKGLAFHINVEQSIPAQLYGDEVRIKQILINLLNNAVKYTPEGSVTLSIQCRKKENDTVYVTYSVSDTGMGIRKESIPYLFSAFKRVDEEQNRYIEGTGLGLSIVKQLVTLMDGDIEVNSVYTKGSTFLVTLPQKQIGENQIGELDLETRHTMRRREHYRSIFEAPRARVLIVDDNDANLMVAEKLLQDTKVGVDTASSGQECLKMALQTRYDVIFMDHLMPVMDGIECLHLLRSQSGGLNGETPVVILTANAGGQNQALYKREGFDGYLLKPVSGSQLETELLRHLPRELVKMTNMSGNNDVVVGPVLGHDKKQILMITTDSVSDLPEQIVAKYQIAVQPYRVVTEGGEFRDGEEIESDGVMEYLVGRSKRAHSEAPKVADYEAFFAEQLTKAQHIIHIAMAKGTSSGYRNALEASGSFDNVTVVNSGHLSSGMGLIVLYAAKAAAEGMTTEGVLAEIESMKRRAKTSFVVDSTEYLARSGRISAKISRMCEACMLHPVLVLRKSNMTVGAIHIGMRKNVWKKYIRSELKRPNRIDKRMLFITYAGLVPGELDEIAAQVRELVPFETVLYQKASPAISTNCGPGTFGLLFLET